MRRPFLLAGLLLLIPAAARAQVTIDLRALDALPNTPPPITSAPLRAPRPSPQHAPEAKPEAKTATVTLPPMPERPVVPPMPTPPTMPKLPPPPTPPATTPPASPLPAATPPAAPATLPAAPPPVVALAPIPPPAAPANPTPPPAPPVSAGAGTTAAPEPTGLQLVFKPSESDLSPDANAALAKLVKDTPTGDTISYNVVAYASGTADDPSVARRASLARGLAVRTALIADGVSSTRIYVRALGSAPGGGPIDRVDVTVMGLSGAAVPVKQ